ncbi:alpha/beta hydrolase family protein [Crateriforma conspicua]|uniref:alpha/beta hydrolase family protein n=1 Tax=Crateriforma conspicua TaxID=2527996 RepID=UPI0011B83C26|nr:alpha/beta fold hydrolase [Crateriforma conspicua]
MPRHSFRVRFDGGAGFPLAGIVDRDDSHPDAPVVLFNHCFTCNKDLKAIVRISRRLADAGLTVLRYDMTGLGGSEGDFAQTNFTTNLADLHAAARFAADQLGPVRTMVGHSFGGAASMMAAGRRTDDGPLAELACLVTLAAPSDTRHLADLLVHMDGRIESEGRGEVTIGGFRYAIDRQMVEDFRTHDLTAAIASIDLPTMILHSPVDETVGYDQAIRIQTLINQRPGADALASLVTLAGADHLLVRQSKDLTFVADMIAALVHRYAGK